MKFTFTEKPSQNDLMMKDFIIKHIQDALDIVNSRFVKKTVIDEVIYCNEIRSLGVASIANGNKIYISMKYTFDCKELRETCFHEVAHITDVVVYGTWGHGKNWKSIMRFFGLSDKATASIEKCAAAGIEVKARKRQKRHLVVCSECNHPYYLSGHRMKKINYYVCNRASCVGKMIKLVNTGKLVDINK